MTVNTVRTIQNQVYEILKSNISAGVYQPNQRLQEIDIATELNVSRSPVREAFRELTAEGLLVALPNKGVYVKEFSEKDFREIFEMRLLLENHAIRTLTAEDVAEMEPRFAEILDMMERACKTHNIDLYVRADTEFHRMLVESCGNDLLASTYSRTITMVHHSIRHALRASERLIGSEVEHAELIRLLQSGRFEEAARQNEHHLHRTCNALVCKVFGPHKR